MENNDYWIDSHCHLHDFQESELDEVLQTCHQYNIKHILTNSTEKENFAKTINISQNSSNINIIPGIGYHPWFLTPILENENWFEEFKKSVNELISNNKTFFIGEIGIDGGKPKK